MAKCRDLYQGARCCKEKGHTEKEHQANNGVTWPDASQFHVFRAAGPYDEVSGEGEGVTLQILPEVKVKPAEEIVEAISIAAVPLGV